MLSAIPLASLTVLTANNLTFLVIPAIAAALLGRLVSLWWTLLGGIAIGVLQAMVTPVTELAPYRSLVPFVAAVAITLWLGRRVSYTTRTASMMPPVLSRDPRQLLALGGRAGRARRAPVGRR